MGNLINLEFYKFFRTLKMLGIALILLGFGIYVSSTASEIMSTSEFWTNYGEFDLPIALKMMRLDESIPNLGEAIRIKKETQFPLVFQFALYNGAFWLGMLMAPFWICFDFKNHFKRLICTGNSRTKIFFTKFISYNVMSLLIGFLMLFALLGIYTSNITREGAGDLYLSFAMLWTAHMSIAMLVAYICKNPYLTATVQVVVMLIERAIPLLPLGLAGFDWLWKCPMTPSDAIAVSMTSLITVAVFTGLSYLVFRRSDFK